MLPLCCCLRLPPAQAPLWLLSPASGNAERAQRAQTPGAPARAPGRTALPPPRLQSIGTRVPQHRQDLFASQHPLRGWGYSSIRFPSLFTFFRVPGQLPSLPPLPRLRGREPFRSSLVAGTRSLSPLRGFSHFRDSGRTLASESSNSALRTFLVPQRSGLPHFTSLKHTLSWELSLFTLESTLPAPRPKTLLPPPLFSFILILPIFPFRSSAFYPSLGRFWTNPVFKFS